MLMDETTARPSPADSPPAAGSRWIDAALLGLLLLLAGGVHAWLLLHTRVPARDTIGYVRHALRFEKEPWLQVLPSIDQHPLYALTVLGISVPVRHLMGGGVSCDAMMLSAQLAATFAGVLLVIPTYFLGRTLFNRRVGFWSAALFQALPVSAQVTVDGLSDALFLLTAAAALAFAVAALRRRSPIQLALCGLCTGLAYLARPEGLLVAPAVLLVLAAEQVLRARRWPWRRALAGAVCLLVPLAAVSGPYIAAIGKLTVKPTPQKLLGTSKAQDTLPRTAAPTRGPLLALWWNDGRHHGTPPIYWAAWAVARETARSFQYIAGLTAAEHAPIPAPGWCSCSARSTD
jgi:4-amino-4-deoxy-L-arabinose transferase-like glycosyltransferase